MVCLDLLSYTVLYRIIFGLLKCGNQWTIFLISEFFIANYIMYGNSQIALHNAIDSRLDRYCITGSFHHHKNTTVKYVCFIYTQKSVMRLIASLIIVMSKFIFQNNESYNCAKGKFKIIRIQHQQTTRNCRNYSLRGDL